MPPRLNFRRAFTLIELLVAMVILMVMLVIVFSVITQATSVWKRSSNKVEAFKSARAGFNLLTRNLSQATLNSYLDYDNATNPARYLRKSELKFFIGRSGTGGVPGAADSGQAIFFQMPGGYTLNNATYGGLDSLLNTCGYYVAFTTNANIPPHVAPLSNPYRYRLMQMLAPVESNSVYTAAGNGWFTSTGFRSAPVADNIIALIVRPQDPSSSPADLTTDYSYDSTLNATDNPQPATAHQLPPVVQVTMVAIDEVSAARPGTPGIIAGQLAGKFIIAANYDSDLGKLEQKLLENHIDCRIFSSAVPIRESKWTK